MYQQLWGHKVEEKIYLGVRERKRFNITGLTHSRHYTNCILLLLHSEQQEFSPLIRARIIN